MFFFKWPSVINFLFIYLMITPVTSKGNSVKQYHFVNFFLYCFILPVILFIRIACPMYAIHLVVKLAYDTVRETGCKLRGALKLFEE